MSVLVEAHSVIVRLAALRDKYPGGVDAYRENCPNSTFCADEHLARIGFMMPDDVRGFVESLTRRGLVGLRGGEAIDIVIVDQFHGPTDRCSWIEGGRHPEGHGEVWLAGTEPGEFVAPEGWTIGQSQRMNFVALENIAEVHFPLGTDDGLEVVLDLKTGQERYIGRVHREPDSQERPER
jgi:hypothetical protein